MNIEETLAKLKSKDEYDKITFKDNDIGYVLSKKWLFISSDKHAPISNHHLFMPNGKDIKNCILHGSDYVIVSKEIWESLVNEFGGGPEIEVAFIYDQKTGKVVPKFPSTQFRIFYKDEKVDLFLSNYDTFGKLKSIACKQLLKGTVDENDVLLIHNKTRKVQSHNNNELIKKCIGDDDNNIRYYEFRIQLNADEKWIENESQNTQKHQTKGLVGIINTKSSCYIISVFQVLAHFKPVYEFFLSGKDQNFHDNKITLAFISLLDELWSTKKNNLNISKLKHEIGSKYKIFDNEAQQDAHELLLVLLPELICSTSPEVQSEIWFEQSELKESEGFDETIASQNWEKLLQHNQSPLYQLFYTLTIKTLKCPKCNHCTTSYIPEFVIEVPLSITNKNHELLEEFKSQSSLTFKCSHCNEEVNQIPTQHFWNPPKFLIFHTFSSQLNYLIDYPNELDITDWVENKTSNQKFKYQLVAVIYRFGLQNCGHFFSHIKLDKWYVFNDSGVFPCSNNSPEKENGFLLFYESIFSQDV